MSSHDVLCRNNDGFDFCLEIRRIRIWKMPLVLLRVNYGFAAEDALDRRVGASALVLRTRTSATNGSAILAALETRDRSLKISQRSTRTESDAVGDSPARTRAPPVGMAQRCAIQAATVTLAESRMR